MRPSAKGMGITPSGRVMAPKTMADAAVTEATDAMEPTEMSSMPATMTTVWPTARRPTMTIDWLRLFRRFCQERNSGCRSRCQMMTTTMTTMAMSNERLSTPRPR